MTNSTIDLLLNRRSLVSAKQDAPAPNREELEIMLRCGTRVPDHGKLAPWRIQIVEGDARQKLGDVFAARYIEKHGDSDHEQIEIERNRPLRSPLIIIVRSHITDTSRIPHIEQLMSGGAVCQNLLIAAHALGYVGQWLSEWVAFDDVIKDHLGVDNDNEILGYLYFGTCNIEQADRPRPSLNEVVSFYGA